MSDPFAICEATVRRHDPDRYFAALFAPEGERRHLFALAALYYELAHIVSSVHEPMIAAIRFAWWRETVEAARKGSAREHAVAKALAETLKAHDLPQTLFERMVDGWGEAPEPFASAADVADNAAVRIGSLMALSARILGGDGDFSNAAIAYGLAGQRFQAGFDNDSLARHHFLAARKMRYPKALLPAVMPAALTPLYLKHQAPPLWRKQLVYLRVAFTGRL